MTDDRRVFISYARRDRDLALRAAAELEALGVAHFLDEKSVGWGERFEGAIQDAIRDCSHLLAVISPASRKSSWVPFELGLAHAYGLTILPLLTEPRVELFPFLRSLNYKTDVSAVRDYFARPARPSRTDLRNPKPYAIGPHVIGDMYLMFGNYTSPVPVQSRYVDVPLEIPLDVRPDYEELRRIAKERARALGAQYFDGPNTRLVRFTEEGTRQLEGGHEQKELTLELGPVSWEEYTILNTFLDHPLTTGSTMRKLYADRERLFRNDRDMSWCKLSGILSLGMTPVTSDGFGLVQRRNPRGVSTEGGRYTSGLAENIHRYLDEAPADDVFQRLHDLELPVEVHRTGHVDARYRPSGTPSPYLAAQRGLWEEISESLVDEVPITSVRFLNVGFELSKFQPVLIGVIDLGLSRDEVERRRRVSPGRDHSEYLEVLYCRLDHRDPDTARLLADPSRWVPGGFAALISGIHWWRAAAR